MNRLVINWYLWAGIASLICAASCDEDIAPPPQGDGTGNDSGTGGITGGGHEGTADSASGNDGGADGAESGTTGGEDADGKHVCLVGITIAHNLVRSQADAGDAVALPPLAWSVELASLAQAHADDLAAGGCELSSSGSGYGENLTYFSQQVVAQKVVEEWGAEKNCYTYGMFMTTDICATKCDQCGHYTQIVWRSTAELGCGYADCGGDASGQIWVCYYNPAGNIVGQYPY